MKFSRFLSRYMDGDQHNSQIMTNLVCPPQFVSNQKLHSISAMKCSNDSNFDMFTMMKENALFLLELSSTNSRKFRFWWTFSACFNKQMNILVLQRYWAISGNFHIKCQLWVNITWWTRIVLAQVVLINMQVDSEEVINENLKHRRLNWFGRCRIYFYALTHWGLLSPRIRHHMTESDIRRAALIE